MAGPAWQTLKKLFGGIGAAALVVGLVVYGSLEPLEGWSLSRLYDLRGPREPTAPIAIVTIDESSINELGQWPFPRALHGQVIQRISEGKPLAIGVDLIFDAPSPRGPDDDMVLSESIALAGNVVLGASRTEDFQGFYIRESLNFPTPEIRRGAAGVAPVNVIKDPDGYVRRVPLAVRLGDEPFDAFDVQLVRLAVKAGLPAAPLPATPDILVNFRGGPMTFPWVPFYRVLNGEIPPAAFKDKIVLIGPTSEVMHDLFATPFAGADTMPGVEIHANAIDTYIAGDRLREAPVWTSWALAALTAVAAAALVVRLHAVRALLVVALLWVAIAGSVFWIFYLGGVWFRGIAPTIGLVLGYGATVVESYIREQREKRRLSQFFSPNVLTHVVRQKDAMKSSRRLVTVLFSDIRGFTSISEKLQPEQVAEMLQEYLTELTEVVFKHGGTVDKYIGDCIMALYNVPFGDPNHAANAIRTGLDFQEKTLEVSKRWEERVGVKIRNGVGVNTGEAVVGTMGSRQRLEYTAIGDTINLGARLESITKEYGASIIISEFTYELVKGQFMVRELGAVTVKGKTQPVRIYAVLPSDLRQHARAVIDAGAVLTATDDEQQVGVHVRDVSEGGIAIEGLPEGWAKGKAVQIRCEGGGLPKPVVTDGTIVWRRDGVAGVAFAALPSDALAAVSDYVAKRRSG
ncbi:MAG: CHASE2 domain-containing protein [Candidatus Rokubacteria bacterium]|nr:CHASE2 domain-containing protein [Candidatus Rokubacteria bacterium]